MFKEFMREENEVVDNIKLVDWFWYVAKRNIIYDFSI